MCKLGADIPSGGIGWEKVAENVDASKKWQVIGYSRVAFSKHKNNAYKKRDCDSPKVHREQSVIHHLPFGACFTC